MPRSVCAFWYSAFSNCILGHFARQCTFTLCTFGVQFTWQCVLQHFYILCTFYILELSLPGGVSSGTLTCRSPSLEAAPAKVHAGPPPETRNAFRYFPREGLHHQCPAGWYLLKTEIQNMQFDVYFAQDQTLTTFDMPTILEGCVCYQMSRLCLCIHI